MTKEWVQAITGAAVIFTAGAIVCLSENPPALKALGTFAAGVVPIMASLVALYIAANQKQQAIDQFAEERRHATEMANDERRYREALDRDERERNLRKERRSDYKIGHWLIRTIAPGLRTLDSYSESIRRNTGRHKVYAQEILISIHVKHVTSSVLSLGPDVFHDLRLQNIFTIYLSSWNAHIGAIEELVKDLDWEEEQIRNLGDISSLKRNTNVLIKAILDIDVDGQKYDFRVGPSGWSDLIRDD